jgi:hypothetical protein
VDQVGDISITTASGTLTLLQGQYGVHSSGRGAIRLEAGGANSDVQMFSNVSGHGGSITVISPRDILLGTGNSLAGAGAHGTAVSTVGVATTLDGSGATMGSTVLTVQNAGGFEANQFVHLVQGTVAEYVKITNVDMVARTLTLANPLSRNYQSTTQVLALHEAATIQSASNINDSTITVNNTHSLQVGTRIDIESADANGIQSRVITAVNGSLITISQPLTAAVTTTSRIYATSDSSITLTANRNLLAGNGTLLTTDNLRSGSYSNLIGDKIFVTVDADRNASRQDRNLDGQLTIADYVGPGGIADGILLTGKDTRIRTDGGVATFFANIPIISQTAVASDTAFFKDFIDPQIAAIGGADSDLNYLVTFDLLLQSPGEENLRVDVDWRNPAGGRDEPNARIESTYLSYGDGITPSKVSQSFSLDDFREFFAIKRRVLLIDFAVSHHETIQLTADAGVQGTRSALPWVSDPGLPGEVSLTGNLSTTDNKGTTNSPGTPQPAGPYYSDPAGINRTVAWVADDINSNSDYLFEGGIVKLELPVPPFQPIETNSRFTPPPPAPLMVRELYIPPITNPEPREIEELPLEQPSQVSRDIYQLRIRANKEFTVYENSSGRKDDIEDGETLLHPKLLRAWVQEEDITTASDLSLWLITRKKSPSGAEVVAERQLLEFDVRDGIPFPRGEELPSLVPGDLKLTPAQPDELPEPANPAEPNGAALEQPADPAAAAATQLNAAIDPDAATDPSEAEEPVEAAPSMIAGLMVSQALKGKSLPAAKRFGNAALRVTQSLRNHRRS